MKQETEKLEKSLSQVTEMMEKLNAAVSNTLAIVANHQHLSDGSVIYIDPKNDAIIRLAKQPSKTIKHKKKKSDESIKVSDELKIELKRVGTDNNDESE